MLASDAARILVERTPGRMTGRTDRFWTPPRESGSNNERGRTMSTSNTAGAGGKEQVADQAPLLDRPEDHPQEVVASHGDSDIVIIDSARYCDERNRGDVVIAASYCGVLPVRLIAPHSPRGVIAHDVGIAADGSGIARPVVPRGHRRARSERRRAVGRTGQRSRHVRVRSDLPGEHPRRTLRRRSGHVRAGGRRPAGDPGPGQPVRHHQGPPGAQGLRRRRSLDRRHGLDRLRAARRTRTTCSSPPDTPARPAPSSSRPCRRGASSAPTAVRPRTARAPPASPRSTTPVCRARATTSRPPAWATRSTPGSEGLISAANELARERGVRPGQTVQAAAQLLLADDPTSGGRRRRGAVSSTGTGPPGARCSAPVSSPGSPRSSPKDWRGCVT